MLIEVIGEQEGEIIARGDIYENGVKLATLKMYFKQGLLENAKIGVQYALTQRWVKDKYEQGEIAYIEI